MIRFHGFSDGRFHELPVEDGARPGSGAAVWIDLRDPQPDEERAAEALVKAPLPTRQEMAEIEDSARLYREGEALVMTAVVVDGVANGRPSRSELTFLLTPEHLVTLRYAELAPFKGFSQRVRRAPADNDSAVGIFVSLLESIVERIADMLEAVSFELNEFSTTIFYDDEPTERAAAKARPDLPALIRLLGRKNRALALLRESLLGLDRLLPFLRQAGADWLKDGASARLKAVERDVRSLAAFETQLEQQISFLHEATLGLINVEQNAIIKVFSIAAVLFLPPTLVGTVYGMNFDVMPELAWRWGYPFALGTMVLSAIVPYYWFKRRGWL